MAEAILDTLDRAVSCLEDPARTGSLLAELDASLRGEPGVRALVRSPRLANAMLERLDVLDAGALEHERALDAPDTVDGPDRERRATQVGLLRDRLWALRRDRIRTATEVAAWAGVDASDSALAGYLALQQTLSALDRLEVRGRDSAGLHIWVWNHGLDAEDPVVAEELTRRGGDPLFVSGAVRFVEGTLGFVYKAAAEIGELGDNSAVIRRAIAQDALLRRALESPEARVSVIAHTRWASVGIISEPNAHPVNSDEIADVDAGDYLVAALNGDVDNHADLKAAHGLQLAAPITTDAKVIPTLVARESRRVPLVEAFRRSVESFDGSVAIAAGAASQPGQILLALRGSGQGLYVGVGDDMFIVASEPYGVVEETDTYLRLDGEAPVDPTRPSTRGQIVVLDAERSGEIEGISRCAYDGTMIPVAASDLAVTDITTRDIDRGDATHFLLKEVTEAPDSLRKTLRGRIHDHEGLWRADLGEDAFPARIAAALAARQIRRVLVIGQGTAAVAGRSTAAVLSDLVDGVVQAEALTATELSGFGLRRDMSDTLVIAVSQSGTTTDTNRTVDLVRARGAFVLAVVNRRGSDLTDRSDGVVYTSDGRDVEMSVASTKAFYAQVAAGVLLACSIAQALGCDGAQRRSRLLDSLRQLPDVLRAVLERREEIALAATRFAPSRRHWAVVGSGANAVAAAEIRIKLSELCYKSISCDVIEDKKHIDLSSEPMILVCAAGLVGSNADDVAKEVAIYRAHKATPVVVATEGEERFAAASAVITVPVVDPVLAFVPCAMVGHLFGYEAARAIDASARPLREIRQAIEKALEHTTRAEAVLDEVRTRSRSALAKFHEILATGGYDGQLEASTAVRLVGRLSVAFDGVSATGDPADRGAIAGPVAILDDLAAALTAAIEELTRPVDAIKHQAKTVTVGISRSDEGIADRALVAALLDTGVGRDRLTYRSLKVIADLDAAVDAVLGYTRYAIEGEPEVSDGQDGLPASITIVDRGGLARDVVSRVETDHRLRGTKRRVALEREVLVARGRHDGRSVILVPEVKGSTTTGITLLHVRFHDRLPVATMRSVLQGYDRRYGRLVDWVSETEGVFRDDRLGELAVVDVLTLPISEVADHWRP